MPEIDTTVQNQIVSAGANRRQLLMRAGMVGAAAVGASLLGTRQETQAEAAGFTFKGTSGKGFKGNAYDILNFALNLEYLEAEFYLRALNGVGLSAADRSGVGGAGGTVTGGAAVPWTSATSVIHEYANEIANDEQNHVQTLRSVLGKRAVAAPNIDFTNAFTAAAVAAGVIQQGQTFDPFASEDDFLLGAFIFEDVGVTAYHGGAAYLSGSILSDAAGILAVEAYHSGAVRSSLYALGQTSPSLITAANLISALRNAASNAAGATEPQNTDQGITGLAGADDTTDTVTANIVPADPTTSIAFARTFQQVLNIVYLNAAPTLKVGGFFPNGLNGRIA